MPYWRPATRTVLTVSPSLYLSEKGCARSNSIISTAAGRKTIKHAAMTDQTGSDAHLFTGKRRAVPGVGVRQARGGFWYPLPK